MGMSFNPGNQGGPYQARPDLGPGVGFGAGLPQPNQGGAGGGWSEDPGFGYGVMPPEYNQDGGLDAFGNPGTNPYMAGGGPAYESDYAQGAGPGFGYNPPPEEVGSPGVVLDQGGGYGVEPPVQTPAPMQTAQFMNQQKPITQGTGQLPPGFGAPSPIDRSQISPNARAGFGMPINGAMTRGNLNDYNGNPLNGGPLGTQNTMASPQQMSGGFGGGKSGALVNNLGGMNTGRPNMNPPAPKLAPRPAQPAPRPAPKLAPKPAPRPAQPASQARRVPAPIVAPNQFTRTRAKR